MPTLPRAALSIALVLFLVIPACAAPGILIADFEGDTYSDWSAEGTAFGPGPARGTLPGQMPVSGFEGRGLVNSYLNGDGTTGTLTSPPFVIERDYLQFLVGGGMAPGVTCMDLLVEGQVVRTVTGPNERPGGSERLHLADWDLRDLRGRTAVLRITDNATGGWGHINIDQIVLTDTPLREVSKTVELRLSQQYLNFPVRTGAPMRRMKVEIEGGPTREFDIELDPDRPEFWTFMDVSPCTGKTARITSVVIESGEPQGVIVKQSAEIEGAADLYHEALRPQVHFSSRRGWNNDPNGLVYHDGEYHLFYQHNPYGWNWGNMHWGHAVSPDLMHWTELPEALYPDPLGPMFSGSAVIDESNTAGFQTGKEPPLVCIYTAAGNPCVQCIAYSNDRGRTFTKYEGNPVVPHIIGGNRDPKVIWYAPDSRWIMALFLDGDAYTLLQSKDLKTWERLNDVSVPGTSECPEFFPIALDGNPADTRWVFYGGNGGYLVGHFDGTTFTAESGPNRMHWGTCFYASQTYNGIPAADGRRILIPWGTVSMPGMPFNQMMGMPVELTLRSTPEGPRLFAVPVRELSVLHRAAHRFDLVDLTEGTLPLEGLDAELLHLKVDMVPGDAREVGLNVRGVPVVFDAETGELTVGDVRAPLKAHGGRFQLEIVVDRTSVEVFGNGGELYMPCGALLDAAKRGVEVICRGGVARVESLQAWDLASAWDPR